MTRTTAKSAEPEDQLRSFIEKFEPRHQAIIRGARKKLRKRFPTATELVYDNYNFFVIGFGPNDRPSDCIVTIAAAANGRRFVFCSRSKPARSGQIVAGLRQTDTVCPPVFSGHSGTTIGPETTFNRGRAGEHSAPSRRPRKAHHTLSLNETETPPQITEDLTNRLANCRLPMIRMLSAQRRETSPSSKWKLQTRSNALSRGAARVI
jgi:hypothetical protein